MFGFVSFFLFFLQDLKEGVLTSLKDLNWALRDGCHFCTWGFAGRKHRELKTMNND